MKAKGITKKVLRKTKTIKQGLKLKRRKDFIDAQKQFFQYLAEGREPLYMDEMYSTGRSIQPKAWMVKLKNLKVTQNELDIEKICVMAGFTESKGLEAALVRRGSITQDTVIEWLN